MRRSKSFATGLATSFRCTSATHAAAVSLARDHGFAFYDALIIAAALGRGCDTLFSEDMQHGRRVAGLTIVNPFASSDR